MDPSTWDFDAPGFVDFGANEHEAVGRESYFDYDHELLKDDGTTKENCQQLDPLKDSKQAGRRLTFDTPVRTTSCQSVSLSDVIEESVCHSIQRPQQEVTANETQDTSTSQLVPMESSEPPVLSDIKSENSKIDDMPSDCVQEQASTSVPPKSITKPSRSNQKRVLRRSKRLMKDDSVAAPAQKETQPPSKKKKKFHLTHASTPTVMRRRSPALGSTTKMKSTADMEIEQIAKLKEEQKKRLQENSKSMKLALAGPARPPSPAKFAHSIEYKCKSDKESGKNTRLSSEIDFTKELRHYQPSKAPPKRTVVQPFNFSTRKRKLEEEVRPTDKPYSFNAKAKANTNFPKTRSSAKKGPIKAFPMVTDAKTPKLLTKSRSRPVHIVSDKEREDMELEEIRRNRFKAKPVDHTILEHATALPEVEKRRTTQPEEFHLHLDKRIKERPLPTQSTSPVREFKANPIPKSFYEGPSNLTKLRTEPTVAHSPNFQLKKRMEIAHVRKESKLAQEKENANPSMATKEPLKKVVKKHAPPERHSTELQPFSFDRSDRERYAKKEAKIEALHEANRQKASSFRAQPIVYESRPLDALPPKMTKPATKPQPFQLESDLRGNAYVEKWKDQLKKQEEEMREKAEFKANRSYQKIISNPGFVPIHSEKENCEFAEFNLHTQLRATERHNFEEKQKQREAEILQRAEDIRMEVERRAEEEARRQRKEAEHKAAPIRKYIPVLIKESEKMPTVAQSPNFSDRFYKK